METRATILIVEDQASAREKLTRTLKDEGYKVVAAADGQEALDRFRADSPDLLLLDVVMPRVGGLEVLRIIKAATKESFLPVILISSKADVESRVAGLRAGADDYIAKPFDDAELLARIESQLRIKKTRTEGGSTLIDPQTGLYNQRQMLRRINEEFARSQRYGEPLSLMLIQPDGPAADGLGARTLAALAEAFSKHARSSDLLSRDEASGFMMLLPGTHFTGALPIAQQILGSARTEKTNVSVGISFYPSRDVGTGEELIKQADAAIKQARAEGGNCACLHQHQAYVYKPGVP